MFYNKKANILRTFKNKFTYQYEFFDELLSVKILCRPCRSAEIRICGSEKLRNFKAKTY